MDVRLRNSRVETCWMSSSVIATSVCPRYCATWAKLGECSRNSKWMLSRCPVACGQCPVRSVPAIANYYYVEIALLLNYYYSERYKVQYFINFENFALDKKNDQNYFKILVQS